MSCNDVVSVQRDITNTEQLHINKQWASDSSFTEPQSHLMTNLT